MKKYTFYLRAGEDKDGQSIEHVGLKKHLVEAYLSDIFGAFNVIVANGIWKGVAEQTFIYTIIAEKCDLKIKAAKEYLRDTFNQTLVLTTSEEIETL